MEYPHKKSVESIEKGLEVNSENELEESKRIVAMYQEAINRYEVKRGKRGEEISDRGGDKGGIFVSELDPTTFSKGKRGYLCTKKALEWNKPISSGEAFDLRQVEVGWEVKVGQMHNFDTMFNNFFELNYQGGVVLETVKPAVIRGMEKDGKIIVESVVKGSLKMGRPDGSLF